MPSAPPACAEKTPARRRLRVLLAEDNATNRELASRILQKRGHDVLLATTGKEAIETWERESVDAILMDVQMPVMGGLEATERIRARENGSGAQVRIIAMTAHAMKGDRERCLAAGMNEYISKPLDRQRLLSLLEEGVAVDSSSTAAAGTAAAACDCAAFVERIGGDAALAREMAQIFVGDANRLRESIQRALATRDAGELRAAAHALKGAAGNFNASAVVAAATELEQFGKTNEMERALPTAVRLEHELGRLLVELRAFAGVDACAS